MWSSITPPAPGWKQFSIFDKVYPGYYYRTDDSGRYANATGCGNEFASERPMARKFIVDTIKYWLTEYHVDGFRFDLMGILDRETMLEVYREAKKINPSVIIYGEGWDMERVLPAAMMMTQANVQGTGIAAFNDGIRDNIKGDCGSKLAPGFVQGAGPQYGGMERFKLNIKGQSTGRDTTKSIAVASPNETINYDSVHDDPCLWDKLQMSAPNVPENLRINMDKLAAGIVLTAQGVPFLHAGDEFLRSKNLVSNSYNDNDPRVNPINWNLKTQHQDVFNFYRGMIALRIAHPAFRMTEKAAVDQAFEFRDGYSGKPGGVRHPGSCKRRQLEEHPGYLQWVWSGPGLAGKGRLDHRGQRSAGGIGSDAIGQRQDSRRTIFAGHCPHRRRIPV